MSPETLRQVLEHGQGIVEALLGYCLLIVLAVLLGVVAIVRARTRHTVVRVQFERGGQSVTLTRRLGNLADPAPHLDQLLDVATGDEA